jgi:hypothetical protein
MNNFKITPLKLEITNYEITYKHRPIHDEVFHYVLLGENSPQNTAILQEQSLKKTAIITHSSVRNS